MLNKVMLCKLLTGRKGGEEGGRQEEKKRKKWV